MSLKSTVKVLDAERYIWYPKFGTDYRMTRMKTDALILNRKNDFIRASNLRRVRCRVPIHRTVLPPPPLYRR